MRFYRMSPARDDRAGLRMKTAAFRRARVRRRNGAVIGDVEIGNDCSIWYRATFAETSTASASPEIEADREKAVCEGGITHGNRLT
jgi:carbonic anhydrase/acetyltransferase-like protein (isoleucine patch superfamily)